MPFFSGELGSSDYEVTIEKMKSEISREKNALPAGMAMLKGMTCQGGLVALEVKPKHTQKMPASPRASPSQSPRASTPAVARH